MMNKFINGININADFCIVEQNEEVEYSAFTDDGQITLGGSFYGEDVDGNRGVYQITIDHVDVDYDSIKIYDEKGPIEKTEARLKEARSAIIEKLEDYDYREEL